MSLDVNTGAVITLDEAKTYIAEFGNVYPDEVKAFFIGRNKIAMILEQENCMGIRIYNGYDVKELRMNQVLVGVDNDGNDMTAIILDDLKPCPPYCPINSLLA